MAKKNYQSFSQIDYCISQYYSRYLASTIVNEKRTIEKNQNEEYRKALEAENKRALWAGPTHGMHGADAALRAKMAVDATGKWNKMTMDDLVNRVQQKWGNDKRFQQDYSTFVTTFYYNLVAQNGGKESEKLLQYAQSYVQHRLHILTIDQLAREKVPKSTAEYIARKAYSDSLLGLVTPTWGLKDGDTGGKVKSRAQEIFNPSTAAKVAGTVGASLIDTATTGGFGGVGVTVGKKAAIAAVDLGLRGIGEKVVTKEWIDEEYAKKDSKAVFGDENAIYQIQSGAARYKKNGTEFINHINSMLNRKIKVPPLSMDETTRKESNALLAVHKGDSAKLLKTITEKFKKQEIPFNANSTVPAWMLEFNAKKNRAYAASFYAIGVEMNKSGKEWIYFGNKKMSFKEVCQRAYDYAKAAAVQTKPHVPRQVDTGFSASTQKALDELDAGMAKLKANVDKAASSPSKEQSVTASSASLFAGSPYMQATSTTAGAAVSADTARPTAQNPLTAGWGNALEQLGLTGFSDVSKNMGYVLAMLPDMLIGMFTGKNPSMKIDDNLLPLAAVFGGLFVKNPLLKMLLIGFGGANLFNNAGHAALNQGRGNAASATAYKSYPDELLDKRIVNPAMKGSSMIATIDGKPVVINISDAAVDAYEAGKVPLNTLANAVLRKYDERNILASRNYEMQHQEEAVQQQWGLK